MIDYLEQLERDLVEAIDEREGAPARRRRRRPAWRGRDWAPVVTAAVALLIIAGAVALVQRTTSSPDGEQGRPRPLVTLRLIGDLAAIDNTTLRARARGPGGVGTLTIGPSPDLVVRPCCPARGGDPPVDRIRFSWTSARGSLSGCIDNTLSRTPDGRYVWVWDRSARIASATGALRNYRGFDLRVAGAAQPVALRPFHPQSRTRAPAAPGVHPTLAPTRC